MTELTRIADQLDRAFDGDAWHGDPVIRILDGLTAAQAASHPIANAHSIWEIIHHLLAWKTAVPTRLRGEVKELHGADDWPPVNAPSDAAWAKCLADLRSKHNELVAAVRDFPESKLDDLAPARDHSFYVLMQGMVQHDLYHAGQIAILKKALTASV
jgi:uncharacterized damage-inducible protein DinB